MRRASRTSDNYVERIPVRNEKLRWSVENDEVTLEVEHVGVWHTLAQKLLKKPRVTYVHLDALGSFIWPLIDGDTTVLAIGEKVEETFGEEAHPLYERLCRYMYLLESNRFISWKSAE